MRYLFSHWRKKESQRIELDGLSHYREVSKQQREEREGRSFALQATLELFTAQKRKLPYPISRDEENGGEKTKVSKQFSINLPTQFKIRNDFIFSWR